MEPNPPKHKMSWSRRIATVRGIPILINIPLILIIPIVAFFFSISSPPLGFENVPNSFVYGMIASIMIFFFVLLHELGHSLYSLRCGVYVISITLYLIGGVSAIDITTDPKFEFRTALVGPLINLGLGAVFFGLSLNVTATVPNLFLQNFAFINLILGGFNILPMLPMDGGRVLRAWLAIRQPYLHATHIAVQIGKILAIAICIAGIFLFQPFLIIIAFSSYIAASDEERQTTITQTLAGIKVRDIMTTEVMTVPPSMSIAQLIEVMFQSKHASYPVVDNGTLVGLISFGNVRQVPTNRRDEIRVGNIMTRDLVPAQPDDEVSKVFVKLAKKRLSSVPVVERGNVVGIVTQKDLISAMNLLSEARESTVRSDSIVI